MESIGTWYWYTGFAIFVIVAIVVSNQPPDTEHLEPMVQRMFASPAVV